MAVGIVLAVAVRFAYQDSREEIQRTQAKKIVALLELAVGSVEGELSALDAVANSPGVDLDVVATLAESQLDQEAPGSMIFVIDGDDVAVSVGADGPTDVRVDVLSELVDRAQLSGQMVTVLVNRLTEGGDPAPMLLLALPKSGARAIVRASPVSGATPIDFPPESPYSDLDFDLYASSQPSPDTLVLTTRSERIVRNSIQLPVGVGADGWLIVTAERSRLTSPLVAQLWWIVLVVFFVAAVIVGVIISLHRRGRESAERASRLKSEFVSRMSHELRTPLNSVLGYAQLLALGDLDDGQARSVRRIRDAGRHLLDLINEALDLSRVEAGTLSLSIEPVLVSDIVNEVLDLQRPIAESAGVNLDVTLCETCEHHVLADRQRLRQVLLNLVSNAVKYNHPGGAVTVECRCPDAVGGGGKLEILVADTGGGINPDEAHLLFEPFERLGAERAGIDGTGIGLALSRQLTEAMGGTLELVSSGEGGSTFKVLLGQAGDPTRGYATVGGAAEVANRSFTLLYVDDNVENVKLLEQILELRPHVELITMMEGRHVVQMAEAHHPALVLLDLHLPDVDGDEILGQLRGLHATADIPIAMLSADASPSQVHRLLDAGAIDYLTKPLHVQRLLDLIDDKIPPP